jgi:two-component system nitrogen regulation response regulator GlnG
MMSNKPPVIFVAEDDRSVRLVVRQALNRQGYVVQSSGNAAGLWKLIESGRGDVLITDVALPDGDALDLLPRIKERRPDLPVIVMSARSTLLTAVKTRQIGVFEYLPKPFELRSLIEVTDRALKADQSNTSTTAVSPKIEEGGPIIGRSRPMQDVFRAMARVVNTDLTVLISGDSGTGKELVARALHDLSGRRDHPFVAVNLAVMLSDFVEFELFGRSVPISGEVNKSQPKFQPGKFEMAEGGTLFLDEIGDMSAEAQKKLLRILQDEEYFSIAGNRTTRAKIRIIAATNRNLNHLMQQGLFREDLFYRLNVVPLKLPPLRERTEDIAPLVTHFLAKSREGGLPFKSFTPEAIKKLKGWHWPGNVRELENLVLRLAVLHDDTIISADAVQAELSADVPKNTVQADSLSLSVETHIKRYFDALSGDMPPPGLYGRVLREVEEPLIVATLAITRGNQLKAADILGLNRNTLRKKIKELDIKAGRHDAR